jgi:hypothetical protein
MGSFNQAQSAFYAQRRIERVQYKIDLFKKFCLETDYFGLNNKFITQVKKYEAILAQLNNHR